MPPRYSQPHEDTDADAIMEEMQKQQRSLVLGLFKLIWYGVLLVASAAVIAGAGTAAYYVVAPYVMPPAEKPVPPLPTPVLQVHYPDGDEYQLTPDREYLVLWFPGGASVFHWVVKRVEDEPAVSVLPNGELVFTDESDMEVVLTRPYCLMGVQEEAWPEVRAMYEENLRTIRDVERLLANPRSRPPQPDEPDDANPDE